jgi:hypothetical protein
MEYETDVAPTWENVLDGGKQFYKLSLADIIDISKKLEYSYFCWNDIIFKIGKNGFTNTKFIRKDIK